MIVEQFVMAYGVEQDKLRSILPEGFRSLRPVLRINAEIRDGKTGYVEFNTAVEADGKRGWLNIGYWENTPFQRNGKTVTFQTPFLDISFSGVGVEGACPAEKDDEGCFFLGVKPILRPHECITVNKEFCNCTFSWHFHDGDARGSSTGKTPPAIPTPVMNVYPRQHFTPEHAAAIACEQVLGAYAVRFEREKTRVQGVDQGTEI